MSFLAENDGKTPVLRAIPVKPPRSNSRPQNQIPRRITRWVFSGKGNSFLFVATSHEGGSCGTVD